MKKYKKVMGLLLGLCVALSAIGCGSVEESKESAQDSVESSVTTESTIAESSTEVVEEKPYKGMEFTVSGFTTDSYFDESGKFTASPATLGAVLYAALDEWAAAV